MYWQLEIIPNFSFWVPLNKIPTYGFECEELFCELFNSMQDYTERLEKDRGKD